MKKNFKLPKKLFNSFRIKKFNKNTILTLSKVDKFPYVHRINVGTSSVSVLLLRSFQTFSSNLSKKSIYSTPKTITCISLINEIKIPKRTVMRAVNVVAKDSAAHSVFCRTSHLSNKPRNFHVIAGTIKKPVEKSQPYLGDNPIEEKQSDTSGFHGVTCVSTCRQNQCHKRHCDTDQSHKTVCPNPTINKESVVELAGALTHTVPKGKEGVELDRTDVKGNPRSRFMVKEKTTIPINIESIKEKKDMTEFVQNKEVAEKIIKNLPPNSVPNLKNTSNIDTPLDDV